LQRQDGQSSHEHLSSFVLTYAGTAYPLLYGICMQRQAVDGARYPRTFSVSNGHMPFLYALVGSWGPTMFPLFWKAFLKFVKHVNRPDAEKLHPLTRQRGVVNHFFWDSERRRLDSDLSTAAYATAYATAYADATVTADDADYTLRVLPLNSIWTPWITLFSTETHSSCLYANLPRNLSLVINHRERGQNYPNSAGKWCRLSESPSSLYNCEVPGAYDIYRPSNLYPYSYSTLLGPDAELLTAEHFVADPQGARRAYVHEYLRRHSSLSTMPEMLLAHASILSAKSAVSRQLNNLYSAFTYFPPLKRLSEWQYDILAQRVGALGAAADHYCLLMELNATNNGGVFEHMQSKCLFTHDEQSLPSGDGSCGDKDSLQRNVIRNPKPKQIGDIAKTGNDSTHENRKDAMHRNELELAGRPLCGVMLSLRRSAELGQASAMLLSSSTSSASSAATLAHANIWENINLFSLDHWVAVLDMVESHMLPHASVLHIGHAHSPLLFMLLSRYWYHDVRVVPCLGKDDKECSDSSSDDICPDGASADAYTQKQCDFLTKLAVDTHESRIKCSGISTSTGIDTGTRDKHHLAIISHVQLALTCGVSSNTSSSLLLNLPTFEYLLVLGDCFGAPSAVFVERSDTATNGHFHEYKLVRRYSLVEDVCSEGAPAQDVGAVLYQGHDWEYQKIPRDASKQKARNGNNSTQDYEYDQTDSCRREDMASSIHTSTGAWAVSRRLRGGLVARQVKLPPNTMWR